jgi:hypothetical protein
MNPQQLSGCAVLLLAGFYLLSIRRPVWRKAGMTLIWLASAIGAYCLTGRLMLRR